MKNQWQRYKELELIPDELRLKPFPTTMQITVKYPKPRQSWLKALWQVVDIILLRDLEARVWQSTDPQTGRSRWHFYNPETGLTQHLNSEAEIRQWLEKVFRH
jgi:hypothetical protein